MHRPAAQGKRVPAHNNHRFSRGKRAAADAQRAQKCPYSPVYPVLRVEEESHLRCHVVLECTRVLAGSNDHRGMSQRRGPARRKETETKQRCKILALRRPRSRREGQVTWSTRFEERVILLCLWLVLNKTSVSRALVDVHIQLCPTPSCTSNHTRPLLPPPCLQPYP